MQYRDIATFNLILEYYATHTYQETCFHFGLTPSDKLRKALSEACPKPERKSGKRHGEYIRTTNPADAKTKTQKSRLKNRGYIYITKNGTNVPIENQLKIL